MSFYKRDIGFIINQPFDFIFEMIFISLIPALLMVFVFARTRNISPQDTIVWFLTILLKLIILHILFQLSGIYTSFFGRLY